MGNLLLPLLFFFVSLAALAQVQTIDDVSKQIVPPSPQAASLGKYGDVPVNYHTGGVTVNIPLYEVKIGSLSLPVSLSYQTSGIRVTDVASRVGLGWTLQGEGVITRTVRGLSDQNGLGFYYLAGIVPYTALSEILDQGQYQLVEFVALGEVDSEPDIYHYNFLGHSGKFYIGVDGKIVMLPHNNLKIEDYATNNWLVTDGDGTKFYFTAKETTVASQNVVSDSYTSSWYLTKIETIKGDEILFNYTTSLPVITYGILMSETDYYSSNGGSKTPSQTFSDQAIGTARLESIETRTEKLVFQYPVEREDLDGDYRLEHIKVFSKIAGDTVKQFNFQYEYSTATAGCYISGYTPTSFDGKRLKLLSVTDRPYGEESPFKKHSFEYNATRLPSRCSFAQDHWGYYNGADGNTTLKPYVSLMSSYTYGDRDVDPAKTGAESLVKITYPTGGYSEFEFEAHEIDSEYYGGQRIKSISDYTNTEVLAKKSNFLYEEPLILNYMAETNYYYLMSEREYSDGCASPGQTYDYVVRSSSNKMTLGTSQGSHIAYGKVTVSWSGINNGKSVYEYSTAEDIGVNYNFPFQPGTNREHRRGLLIREAHYNSDNTLLAETLQSYDFVPIDSIGAFKVGFEHNDHCKDWSNGGQTTDVLALGVYKIVSEWVRLTSKTENAYPGPVTNETAFYYDNPLHLQVTRKERIRTDGKLDLEYFLYPEDYSYDDDFIELLVEARITTALVEHVTAYADANGSNKKITGGKINKYSSTDAGQLKEIHFLELDDPLTLSSFKFSNRATGYLPTESTATTFSPYSVYTGNVYFDSYDAYGNLTQFHTNQGINVSVKWGYNSSRPVVLIKNASLSEFFYEGFEEYSGAIDTHPFAGNKYKSGSYTASFTRPNSRTYMLSYWKLVDNQWQFVKAPLTADNPEINPGSPIDEVFIYPSTSEFKLLNFSPHSFHISNETNSTHTISYYTYDKLQRLQLIRDHHQDIVNEFIYHYRTND